MWKFILILGIIILTGILIYSSLQRNRPISLGMEVSTKSNDKHESKVQEINTENDLQNLLRNSDQLVLLMYMNWCGYCHRMKPEFASASSKSQKPCVWAQLNAENFPDMVRQLQVEVYPTTVIFNRGKVQEVITGAQSEEALLARMESI